ncbi:CHAP domain-containing protein [Catellatospora sp. TT07R-123]|uniref:CHAP domain-containing protein n=1 Tax=Catellatospora sp. TT07R-123 TaxID=2733863 RepID=UPI001BB42CBF|nr:CHAP domain-containing protein [Catellatospora sp. TT07R-123]
MKYVKTRYVLNGVGDAWQWEALLPAEGFTKMTVTTVRVGDIAVWDYNEEPDVGHIAIVQGIYPSSQGLAMSFRGANQRGNPKFTENGCNNVSDWVSATAWATASFFHR